MAREPQLYLVMQSPKSGYRHAFVSTATLVMAQSGTGAIRAAVEAYPAHFVKGDPMCGPLKAVLAAPGKAWRL